jgi:hypothetical protein
MNNGITVGNNLRLIDNDGTIHVQSVSRRDNSTKVWSKYITNNNNLFEKLLLGKSINYPHILDFKNKLKGDLKSNYNYAQHNNSINDTDTGVKSIDSFSREFSQTAYNRVSNEDSSSYSIISVLTDKCPQALFTFDILSMIEDEYERRD